jgi:hypothetical protein
VVLDQANTFTQSVAVDAVNVTLNTASALTLDTSTVTGDFKVSTAVGDITQTGPIAVTGKSTLTTTAGNVMLTDVANSFGDVVDAQTSGALSLSATGPLTMGKVTVQGNADLKSTGVLNLGAGAYAGKLKANSGGFDILQSGPIKFSGDVDFDAGSAKIDLFNPNNLWTGILTFKGGIIMINHPVLMNAVSAGTLVVRVETTVVAPTVKAGGDTAAPALQNIGRGAVGTAVSVAVARTPSASQSGVIQVNVSAEAAAPGKSFTFELDPHAVAGHDTQAPVKIAQIDGKPMPNWLKFDATSKTFTASEVPPGAFPLQLKVSVGNTESVMLIQEKPQK